MPSATRPKNGLKSPVCEPSRSHSKCPTAPGATSPVTLETRVGESHDEAARLLSLSRGIGASFTTPDFHVFAPMFLKSTEPFLGCPAVSWMGAADAYGHD
jgi:hypothetical protein